MTISSTFSKLFHSHHELANNYEISVYQLWVFVHHWWDFCVSVIRFMYITMSNNIINVCTLNVNGLQMKDKQRRLLQWIQNQNCSIHVELYFDSYRSLKHQCTGRHVALLRHIS
jgi:hypothetical protein